MIMTGDCLAVLKTLAENSIDSIVTDPPYGIRFMAKRWDHDVPKIDVWKECLRVLKPGGHMLVACGTRTQHRMVAPIEDAGFEIRDVITWLYSQGFPKSLNVSKAIDKEAGAEREVVGESQYAGRGIRPSVKTNAIGAYFSTDHQPITTPATDAAKQWEGFGTAIKPACEFWTLCRKPSSESTVAKNVLRWATGGLNIDGCRVSVGAELGRFPANLILDEEAAAALDEQTGILKSGSLLPGHKQGRGTGNSIQTSGGVIQKEYGGDSGGASRFFYCAKASKSDRCEGNNHPTVKPTSLMRYLCKLITPPAGTVLDPFAGSGSTGVAALSEGFKFLGIELNSEYVTIAQNRLGLVETNTGCAV